MNLQYQFNKAIVLSFFLSLLMVFLMYYFTVNRTLEREMQSQLNNAVHLHALSVEFTLQSFVTDIQSLGSRTIIRRELHDYTLGKLSLEELIASTKPKYADGAAVIRNIDGGRRFLTNGTIISQFGDQGILRVADLSMPGIFIPENDKNTILVIEAIIEDYDTIGFDAGIFNIEFLLHQTREGITNFKLVPANGPDKHSGPEYLSVKLPTQPFLLHATADKDLIRKRKARSLLSVMGYSLMILLVIAVIFYFTQFRWVKKIINRLISKELLLNTTQKLTQSGGWQYNAQTRESSWTRETYQIFDLTPRNTEIPGHDHIMAAMHCFNKNDRKKLLQSIRSCINEKKVFDLDYPITPRKGTTKWVRIVLHPMETELNTSGMTGTIMDITQQRDAEKEHREKLELEKKMALTDESARFKQNFLANMSHELRTPLNGIIGMNEVLQMTSLSDDQQEYIETIAESAGQLEEMVDRILNFTRIESGNIELNKEEFLLRSFISKLAKYYHRICNKPIRLLTSIKPGTPHSIIADENRIFEVASNLVSNAVKFTQQGSIILTVEVKDYQPETDEALIKIMVSDTGIGIKEDMKRGIIDPFYRLGETDTREFDGSGLGLAMSQRLVTLHGGEMDFTGIPGRGSSVWFTFRAKIQE